MKADALAIIGGFGLSLGDGIIGLQALHAGQSVGLLPKARLYRQSGLGLVDQLYPLAADFAETKALPTGWPPLDARDLAGRFGRVIDIRDFALNPGFRGGAMIDFFLRKLGIDPQAVPSALKRNTWLAPRACLPPSAGRYVLVCPGSSMAMRDMPEAVHQRILRTLCGGQSLPVLTQGDAGDSGAVAAGRCRTIAELLGLVAHARFVVSTDTAMVHLADALGVPCLAFFTTHRPEWRVRDYPLCRAVHLPVAGLPEALEFSRSGEDVAAVRRAWMASADEVVDAVGAMAASKTG